MAKRVKVPGKLFPKTLYVKRVDDETPWYDAGVEHGSHDDGDKVAIYQLVEVKTKRVTHALE